MLLEAIELHLFSSRLFLVIIKLIQGWKANYFTQKIKSKSLIYKQKSNIIFSFSILITNKNTIAYVNKFNAKNSTCTELQLTYETRWLFGSCTSWKSKNKCNYLNIYFYWKK